jgi:hypothetical protein
MRHFKQKLHIIWKLLTNDYTDYHGNNGWLVWGKNSDGHVVTIIFDTDYLMKKEEGRYMTTNSYYTDHPAPTVSG